MPKRRTPNPLPSGLFADSREQREALRQIEWSTPLHAGQQLIDACLAEIIIVACGRRWGKSYWAVRRAVETALATGKWVLWVALTYKVAHNAVWPYICRTVPERYRKLHESKLEVELLGGGGIRIGSLDQADNLRGMGTDVVLIVVDEAAFTRDYDLENVLDPIRLDNSSRLLALCSPNGTQGWFYRYFTIGQDTEQSEIRSFTMPTWSNPTIPNIQAKMNQTRARIPEGVFRQEYGGEFVDSAGAVFRNIRPCELAERETDRTGRPLVHAGADYFVGIDFARAGSDYTVLTILERLANGHLRLAWLDRWGREEDEKQVDRLGAIISRFSPRRVLAEENNFGGVYVSWLRSKHHVEVELFKTTGQSKGPLVLQGAALFEIGRLDIWPESDDLGSVLVGELLSFERGATSSDHPTYSAPQGLHDDCVMSLLLAIRAAEGEPGDEASCGFDGSAEDYLLRDSLAAPLTSLDRFGRRPMGIAA